jgi:hypothetical protein
VKIAKSIVAGITLSIFMIFLASWCVGEVRDKGALNVAQSDSPSMLQSNTGQAPEAVAEDAARQWLAQVDDGNYGDSWDHAAQYFKTAITKNNWEDALNGVRRPLGKVLSRNPIDKKFMKNLPGAPDGDYVVIQYQTSFENKKSAVETVATMLDKDGKWKVAGYFIK